MSIYQRSFTILFTKVSNRVQHTHFQKCKQLLYYEEKSDFCKRYIQTTPYLTANVPFKLSDIGEGIKEVVVKEWFVNVGDNVSQFDKICEVQSDKASVTITSRYDGIISKLHYNVDDTAFVGNPLVDIEINEAGDIPSSSNKTTYVDVEKSKDIYHSAVNHEQSKSLETPSSNEVLAIPSVRRLAKEYKLDLSKVRGTGKKGRILKEDVLLYIESSKGKHKEMKSEVDDSLIERVVPVKGFQKAMVKSMTNALKMPLMTYSDEIIVSKLTELRNTIRSLPEMNNIKISYMPFFIKALSNALSRHPIINASYDEEKESIVYKRHHNIGIAMDTKEGLVIPVIKMVQNLNIIEIAEDLQRLIVKGKEGSFSLSDISDVTVLISNIGIIGGTYLKPVPVSNTSSIFGFGAVKVLPRYDASMNVVPEEIIALSSSADHRIIDGATLARFCNTFKKQIENPYLLLMNL